MFFYSASDLGPETLGYYSCVRTEQRPLGAGQGGWASFWKIAKTIQQWPF